ncbi:MAG: peptidylprolyl isomerase [Planctomycetaceae bacterium]|jgi:hypothetical protein|nr:peptidylprolyl isomerase [Planctomycetaceae bacterium]
MKSFIYLTLLFASIGTVYVAATNPEAVQQGAALLGFSRDPSADSDESEADHLAKFLVDYPYNGKSEESAAGTCPADKNSGLNAVSVPFVESVQPPAPLPVLNPQPVTAKQPPIEPPVPLPALNPVPMQALGANDVPPAAEPAEDRISPLEPLVQVSSENIQPIVPSPIQQTAALQPVQTPEVNKSAEQIPAADIPPFVPEEAGFAISKKSSEVSTANVPPPVPPLQPMQQIPPTVQPAATAVVDPFLPQNEEIKVANIPPQPVVPSPPVASQWNGISEPAPSPVSHIPNPAQYKITPSVLAEEVPCHGTELVARVGTQVILMCDILPQLRRIGMKVMQENVEKASEEERKMLTDAEKEKFVNMFIEHQYPAFLQEQITVALIYNDFTANKNKEEREFFGKKFEEEFDQREIPAMMKEFNVQGLADLKTYLKTQLGSSLERERMLWVRSKIAQQWIMYNVQQASGECTHDEMMEFYRSHLDTFTSQARVQWKELFTAFTNHKTEQEAKDKIAWMGNQVAAGYKFEDIARVNSEGFTASKGGVWDWTKHGALSSQELENAVFTMPLNQMSPIIKSDKGFHIVQVIRREEAKTTPFIDAQVKIREQIKMQRRKKYENDYSAELNRRYPTSILRDQIDFRLK